MFEAIIRRGTLTTVVVLIVCIIGVAAALRSPIQMIPDLDVRTITVFTQWPGATPQDIEKDILIEQEEYLRSIPGLDRLISRASSGSAEIELEFPFDVDMTETMIRVNNALSQVPGYPENVDQPRVYATSFSQNSFMYMRVTPLEGNPRGLDMDMMRDFIDDHVRTRLESVPQVSRADIGGGAERQIQVLLDPAALADRGLSLSEVRQAMRDRNRDISGGTLETGKQRVLLRTVGRFADVEDLGNLIIKRDRDVVVRLRDVAEIRFDHFKINSISRVNGLPAITLSIAREAGSNVIDIKYAVLAEIERINRDVLLPAGMRMELTAEDAGYVEASIANVWTNLAIGTVLVTAVMYFFLRSVGATSVAMAGIPVCTIAAFIGLLIADRTINVISLAGVAFAIGMTLDNSIVVLESIDLERRRGLDRIRAAAEGVRRVWPAVIASTLTTVLVFIPIIFIQEEAGQLYSDVAVAVAASILMSMLVAIMLVPTAAANIDLRSGKSDAADNATVGMEKLALRVVDQLIQGRKRPLAVLLGAVIFSIVTIFILLPSASYLPEGEEPKAFARMNAPAGYNIKAMAEHGQELERRLLPHIGADPDRFERGETSIPPIKYMLLSINADQIRIVTETREPGHINTLMDALTAEMESFPGMRAFASRGSIISSNQGGTRSVNLDISGPNLADIYAVAQAAYRRADEVFENPRVQATPSTLSLSQPLLEIRPRWDRAAELGFDAASLGFAVAAMSDGSYVDEFFREDDKIDIYFYNALGFDVDVNDLAAVPLHTPTGLVVPLGSVVDIVENVDTSTIYRIGGQRTVTLNIIPPPDVALEDGVDVVREDLVNHLRNTGQIPSGVVVDISGAADQLQATQAAIADNYVIALLIIYLVLVAILTHWGFPLLIMATVPLGAAAGIIGLQFLNAIGAVAGFIGFQGIHQPFDMISMLGFLILMGTVVNNPILIVHRMMENMREHAMKVREAVREAVSSRLRAIAMSTITTVFGLLPLVLLPGEGTELYRGVGAIVLFGILGGAIASVTFLPALAVVILSWREPEPALDIPTGGHDEMRRAAE